MEVQDRTLKISPSGKDLPAAKGRGHVALMMPLKPLSEKLEVPDLPALFANAQVGEINKMRLNLVEEGKYDLTAAMEAWGEDAHEGSAAVEGRRPFLQSERRQQEGVRRCRAGVPETPILLGNPDEPPWPHRWKHPGHQRSAEKQAKAGLWLMSPLALPTQEKTRVAPSEQAAPLSRRQGMEAMGVGPARTALGDARPSGALLGIPGWRLAPPTLSHGGGGARGSGLLALILGGGEDGLRRW